MRRLSLGLAVSVVLLPACAADDRAAPNLADLTLAKPDTGSGDGQVGVAGQPLGQDLRVVVTHAGRPVKDIAVTWSTIEGSLTPASSLTDANGVSSTRWTLQHLFAQQVAGAKLDPSGPPTVAFTAIATPDPSALNTVLVGSGGNRFEPAEITIAVNDTVNGSGPRGAGGTTSSPTTATRRRSRGRWCPIPSTTASGSRSPGVYRYHCMAHGGVGGVGMSGTVTVLPQPNR